MTCLHRGRRLLQTLALSLLLVLSPMLGCGTPTSVSTPPAATTPVVSSTPAGTEAATAESNGAKVTNFTDVQSASGNWEQFLQVQPTYVDCSDPACALTLGLNIMTGPIGDPSMDGKTEEFELDPVKPWVDTLSVAQLVGTQNRKNLDVSHTVLPNVHNIQYDVYFWVDKSIWIYSTQALEFDISLWIPAAGQTWGTQCSKEDGNFDYWQNVPGKWNSTGIPCKPILGGWNHLTWYFTRAEDNSLQYNSLIFNGTKYPLNIHDAPTKTPAGWYGLAANVQLDSNVLGHQVYIYVDKMTISYW